MPKSRDAWLAHDSRLLAKVPMDEARLETLERTGLFEQSFSKEKPASQITSLDGAVLVLGASGQIVGLTLSDYVDPEYDREIAFDVATITLRLREDTLYISVFESPASIDPWAPKS